jgi:hypothetical protein
MSPWPCSRLSNFRTLNFRENKSWNFGKILELFGTPNCCDSNALGPVPIRRVITELLTPKSNLTQPNLT